MHMQAPLLSGDGLHYWPRWPRSQLLRHCAVSENFQNLLIHVSCGFSLWDISFMWMWVAKAKSKFETRLCPYWEANITAT